MTKESGGEGLEEEQGEVINTKEEHSASQREVGEEGG